MPTSPDSLNPWKEKISTNLLPVVFQKSEVDQVQLQLLKEIQSQPPKKRKNNNLKNKHQRRRKNQSKKKKTLVWVEDFSIDFAKLYHYLNSSILWVSTLYQHLTTF